MSQKNLKSKNIILRNMDTNMKNIVNFLFEVGSLKKIARSHRQSFLTDDLSDNIASHSHRVSVIGYFLAKFEGVDIGKVLTMCIFHDVGESRSGDHLIQKIHSKMNFLYLILSNENQRFNKQGQVETNMGKSNLLPCLILFT